jgi:hypothetical protein
MPMQFCSLIFLMSSYCIGYVRREQASTSSDPPDVLRVAKAYDIGVSMVTQWSNLMISALLLRG